MDITDKRIKMGGIKTHDNQSLDNQSLDNQSLDNQSRNYNNVQEGIYGGTLDIQQPDIDSLTIVDKLYNNNNNNNNNNNIYKPYNNNISRSNKTRYNNIRSNKINPIGTDTFTVNNTSNKCKNINDIDGFIFK
jgi:hypothetical protein